jgi:hypothetical protein
MTSSRFTLLVLASVAAGATPDLRLNQPLDPEPRRDVQAPTNFSGEELAERLLKNVVTINNAGREAGTGLIIGSLGDKRFILTANHVVVSPSDGNRGSSTSRLQIKRCDGEQQMAAPFSADARIVFADTEWDFAVVEVTSAIDAPMTRILALDDKSSPPTPVWTVGKGGTCAMGSGQIYRARDQNGVLFADLPGGYGGTSGAPVATDRGVIGMVLSEAGAAVVKVRSIDQILQTLTGRNEVTWLAVEANNQPPGSPEDVQFKLSTALNAYMFALKDIRDSLRVEQYTTRDLANRVAAYNTAITNYNALKDEFDGSIVHAWGEGTLTSFDGLRGSIAAIHRVILGLNVSMNDLRRQKTVPREIQRQVVQLSPQVEDLDTKVVTFLEELKVRR